MNTNENDTQSLTWTRHPVVGGTEYRAEANGWKYTVDQPSKGSWVLRGWDFSGEFRLYRDGLTTLKTAKAEAEQHRTNVAAATTLMRGAGRLLAVDPVALGRMADSASSASRDMRRMADAVARVQAARNNVQFRKDTCGCRSPLHTMRCGVTARPVVVGRAA